MQIEWNYNGITDLQEVELDSNHGSVLAGKQTVSDDVIGVIGNAETTRPEALKIRDIHKRQVYSSYDGASLQVHVEFWLRRKP